ncbi:MAG: hypothetical protein ACYS0I_16325 [Planctomycetota bacterium]|jgi:hypothetical protein
MEVYRFQSDQIHLKAACDQEKQKWVEEHARSLQQLFEQWQKQLNIDGNEYRKYLTEELLDYCDEPLLKSLIESIT